MVVQNGGTTVKKATLVRKSGARHHVPSVWSDNTNNSLASCQTEC